MILLAFGLAGISIAQENQETKVAIDDFLLYHEKLNKFNGTVLIAKEGKVLLCKGYGYRDFEKGIPHNANSVFQVYSITKTITSTMVFKLIEQKKLSLDDRLNKFYPFFSNGDNITIAHLLTHTSGINDDTGMPDATQTEEYRVSVFSRNKPHFPPGEGWAYCNGGYQLLGYIIQKVAGMPYENVIRENIFLPLGMSSSGFDFKGLMRSEKAKAYRVFTNLKKEEAMLYDSTGPFSAGAMYSTVGDLYNYYNGLKSHEILTEATQAMAFTPGNTNGQYAHGWQLNSDFSKSLMIFHDGGAAGFRSILP